MREGELVVKFEDLLFGEEGRFGDRWWEQRYVNLGFEGEGKFESWHSGVEEIFGHWYFGVEEWFGNWHFGYKEASGARKRRGEGLKLLNR